MQRLFQYSLRTIFVLTTVLCVWLAWRIRENRRAACDRLIDHALVNVHWLALEENAEIRTAVSDISEAMAPDLHLRYRFLRVDGTFRDGSLADTYETDLLATFLAAKDNGKKQTAERRVGGRHVYYRAIRAKASCTKCHHRPNGNPSVEGDILAIVKVGSER